MSSCWITKCPRNIWGIMYSSGRYDQCLPVSTSPTWSNFLSLMSWERSKHFPHLLKLGREWIFTDPIGAPFIFSIGLVDSQGESVLPWLVILKYFLSFCFGRLVLLTPMIPRPSGDSLTWGVTCEILQPILYDLLWV